MIKKIFRYTRAGFLCVAAIAIVAALVFVHEYQTHRAVIEYQTPEEAANIYVRFDMEAYDTIESNYWAASSTYDLPRLFQASFYKATGANPTLPTDDRPGTAAMLDSVMSATSSTDAQQLAVLTLQIVLYNLQPNGRSSLASAQQVTTLRQEVSNVNPNANLYDDLGVSTSSSESDINQAYTQDIAALANATSSADQAKTKEITYAYKVLSNPNTRMLYTADDIQPAASNSIIGHTLYVSLSKMSPTVVQEFAWDVDAASTTPGLDSLIIDLRGNIGGATNTAQGLAGLFLGNNQYAFDLYHQGNYNVQRTIFPKFAELSRYREIAVLTDNLTQSTAEVLTEVLQHFNIAHVVGNTTRGWGTVENTYPLQTVIDPNMRYALILVNSITLRGDGLPIEAHGVTPDVDISQPDWKSQLPTYFHSTGLINAIEAAIAKPVGQ